MGYSKLAIWSLGRGLNPRPCGALFLPFRLRGGCSLLRDASTRLSHRGTKSVRGQYFDLKLLLTTIDRHIMTCSTLGERQIIRILTRRSATSQPSLPLGFEDKVSVFSISPNRWIVCKT